MARIAGIDLPKEERIEIGLTRIYGIGRPSSLDILQKAKVDASVRVKDLAEDEITRLRTVIESDHKVEGDLRREVAQNIKRLQEIGAYRGLRHRRNLPVRGQRTRTNARTKRGQRRTVAGRRRHKAGKKG